MWFKNLTAYRFTESFSLSPADLERQLEPHAFRPCGKLAPFSCGWTAPLGRSASQLVHSSNGFMMICAAKEEKILPASVINELTGERIDEIEAREARRLRKKERDSIRDEVMDELLPKAFSHTRRTYAYIDPKHGWLVVDAATAKKAEELTGFLRKSIDSLLISPPATNERPATVMTRWLSENSAPKDLTVEDECDLRSPEKEGGIVRCKRHDLYSPEIHSHLVAGKEAIKLALTWNDRLAFLLDENLGIKRLRFLDIIQDQAAEADTADDAAHFDVDFSIMSLELAAFLPRLLELFGGEKVQP
ncbi:MAG: recombination-associated protein RdgC [Pseudomonadota bacterium]